MIREHILHVKAKNNNAAILFGALMTLSAVAVVVYSLIESYRGIVALLAVLMITAAVLVYTKYIGAEYYYEITFDYRGCPLLVVRQTVGKRHSTLCRIALSEIVAVMAETAAERRAHKTPYGTKTYVYTPTLFPTDTCRVITKGAYEQAEIILEISDQFASLLGEYSDEAKTHIYSSENEE